jgi:hypothetical protein
MVLRLFNPIHIKNPRSKIFLVMVKKIRRFYVSKLGEYGKILLAFSLYALKYSLRFLRIS